MQLLMFLIAITAYSEMDNTRTTNEFESSSSEAKMARLERMMELITERLDQQQSPDLLLRYSRNRM